MKNAITYHQDAEATADSLTTGVVRLEAANRLYAPGRPVTVPAAAWARLCELATLRGFTMDADASTTLDNQQASTLAAVLGEARVGAGPELRKHIAAVLGVVSRRCGLRITCAGGL